MVGIEPFKIKGDKLNSANYCDFMDKTFFAWYISYSRFKVKYVFMYNNAPSHVSKLIDEFFEHERFTGEKIMKWLPSSPDLNLIKNLWSMVKMKLYEGGKQYNNKADLWEAIKTTMSEIESAEVKKNYQSQCIIDYWLLLRRKVTILKCKRFKDFSDVFVCSIIGIIGSILGISDDFIAFLLK